jgi:hypothetical protein
MALAHWVGGLDDYSVWIRTVIDGSGGVLVRPPSGNPNFEDTPVVEIGDAECFGFVVEDHRILFYEPGTPFLDFSFEVTLTPDGFEYGEYNYDFRQADGVAIWRYDKHPGHPDVGGTHLHWGPREALAPSGEVDLDDVLGKVREHFSVSGPP